MNVLATKNLIYLSPLVIYALILTFIKVPNLFFISLSFSFLILLFTVKKVYPSGKKHWLSYLFLPAFLLIGMMVYVILLPSRPLVHVISILSVILLIIYLHNIYYFNKPRKNDLAQKQFLDRFSFAISILALFFLSASTYGLSIFLGWKFWYLGIAFVILSFPLMAQPLLINEEKFKKHFLWILISNWLLIQFFVVVYFLPLNFNLLALIMAISFYLLLFIFRLKLKDKLSLKNLRYPIIINIIVVIVVLLSSRWL